MTLERFLTGLADRRWTWPGPRRLRPAADQPFHLPACLAVVAVTVGLALLAGLGLKALLTAAQSPLGGSWWPVRWAFWIGLLFGGYYAVLTRLAWNRRAARLRAAGQAQPVKPRLRVWQWLLLAPVYFAVVLVVTPVALLYAADGALGEWAWRRYHAGLVARGEPVTFEQLVGPMPPDEENFAMTPLLWPALEYTPRPRTEPRGTNSIWNDPAGFARLAALSLPQRELPREGRDATYQRLGLVSPDARTNVFDPANNRVRDVRLRDSRLDLLPYAYAFRTVSNVASGHLDPALAARYGMVARYGAAARVPAIRSDAPFAPASLREAADDVLAALARFEPEMREIEEAAGRPHSRFPLHFDEGFEMLLPHIAFLKGLSLRFATRATARLVQGETEAAFADVLTALRLARTLEEEPLLISFLVQVAQAAIATRAAWQGLVDGQWTEPQLTALQAAFARQDFRAHLHRAMQGERAGVNVTFEIVLRRPEAVREALEGSTAGEDMPPVFLWTSATFVPRGLLRRNQIAINRAHGHLVSALRAPDWPQGVAGRDLDDFEWFRAVGLEPVTPRSVMAWMLLPAVNKADAKAARATVVARLAGTACALERHRLRTGAYPAALAELVPALLPEVPRDPMDGQALRYRRRDDGHFDLWSVGLNGRDDGGVAPLEGEGGDWVWPPPHPTPGLRLF